MADTVVTVNSEAEWEAGEFDGCNALDPAGKLTLGVSSEEIAGYVAEGALAVFIRCREGEGTTLENPGLAGDGTLSNADAWRTRDDGRHYLYGRQVTVAYHASFAIADDEGDKYCQSAGIVVNLASISAQVFMTRTNRFKLGVTAGGLPYASFYDKSSVWRTATGTEALETGVWYELSMTAGNGFVYLYVDGVRKAGVTGFYGRGDYESGGLVVAVSGGSYSTFYLFGDSTSGAALLRGAQSGTWSKVVNLGARQALRKVVVDSAIGPEHSGSISFAFADAEANLDYVPVLSFGLEDQAAWTYWPPEKGLKAGTYVKISVHLSAKSWDRDTPIVDYLTATFRDCVASAYDYEGYEDKPSYEEVLPVEEEPVPEDLNGLIQAYLRQREAIEELKRRTADLGGGMASLGGDVNNIKAQLGIEVDMPPINVDGVWYLGPSQLVWSSVDMMAQQLVDWISELRSQLVENAGGLNVLTGRVTRLEEEAITSADIATMLLDGGDIDNAIDALIATHAGETGGVHGALVGETLATQEYVDDTAIYYVGVHALLTSDVHGAAAGDPLMADSDVDALVKAHSDLDYGVHGCVNLVSDLEDDVQPEIASQITSHEGEADPHPGYCLESGNYATQSWVTSNFATDAEVSSAVTTHDSSLTAHSTQGWVDDSTVDSLISDALQDHCNDVGSYGCNNYDEFF